jgi:hypothetical protein
MDNQESLNLEGEQEASNLDEQRAQEPVGEDELVKAKELAKNYKIRAEKAEKELKSFKEKETPKKPLENEAPKNFSIKDLKTFKDLRALQDVHDDDVEELIDYANRKGISISEAKDKSFVKSFLKEQEEIRQTAQATSTGSSKRTSSKMSDDILLEKAEKGELKDDEFTRAARVRIDRMKKERGL